MEITLGHKGATRQSWSRDSIRVIIAELQAEHPKAGQQRLVSLLAERLREDDDALVAAADYAVANTLNSQEDLRRRERAKRPGERAATMQAVEQRVEKIVAQIILLNQEMPNGKRMRYCTGREMATFGAGYQRIAKMVGPNAMVGSKLNEQQVRKAMRL